MSHSVASAASSIRGKNRSNPAMLLGTDCGGRWGRGEDVSWGVSIAPLAGEEMVYLASQDLSHTNLSDGSRYTVSIAYITSPSKRRVLSASHASHDVYLPCIWDESFPVVWVGRYSLTMHKMNKAAP